LYLAQLFRANPLMALALLICLATILWCILLIRRQRNSVDKVLTGLLGLIAIYESLRILKDSGIAMFAHFHMLEGWVDFISACLYMVAALILKTSSVDRAATRVHLRLMEAGEKPMDLSNVALAAVSELGHPLVDSLPLAVLAARSRSYPARLTGSCAPSDSTATRLSLAYGSILATRSRLTMTSGEFARTAPDRAPLPGSKWSAPSNSFALAVQRT
jgi:hypothetical protein